MGFRCRRQDGFPAEAAHGHYGQNRRKYPFHGRLNRLGCEALQGRAVPPQLPLFRARLSKWRILAILENSGLLRVQRAERSTVYGSFTVRPIALLRRSKRLKINFYLFLEQYVMAWSTCANTLNVFNLSL